LITGVSEKGNAIFVVSVLFSTLYGSFLCPSGVLLRFLRCLVAPTALFSALLDRCCCCCCCSSSSGGGVPFDNRADLLGLETIFSTVATGVEKVFIRRAAFAFFSPAVGDSGG
jgi:hypothetical protein